MPPYNVTDQQLMAESAYSLLENGNADASPSAWITTQYSPAQMLAALNDRQRRFLKDTGCIVTRNPNIGGTPQQSRYALPATWIATRRLTWTPQAGSTYALFRTDTFELDNELLDWQQNFADPISFHESTLPTLTIEIAKAPSNAGTLGILYVALSTLLDNSGIVMTVPDEFSPYIKWAAIGDLLAQDGEGSDPKRAQFCYQMYDMGVEMARMLMIGSHITEGFELLMNTMQGTK